MQGVHKGKHDCAVFILLLRQPLSILIVLWDVLVTVDVKICTGYAEEALLVILLFISLLNPSSNEPMPHLHRAA